MDSVLAAIDQALSRAQDLNQTGVPTRSRQLSLAITDLESARFRVVAARDEQNLEIARAQIAAATPPADA